MVDNMSEENRRKTMRSIKSKQTKLENLIHKELWRRGYRLRRNTASLFGKPDFSLKKNKLVIFVDSCFWHGCPLHCTLPTTNTAYWQQKLKRNVERDTEVTEHYVAIGWRILRIWEHDLKQNVRDVIQIICSEVDNVREHKLPERNMIDQTERPTNTRSE